jgi:hypothetical protein
LRDEFSDYALDGLSWISALVAAFVNTGANASPIVSYSNVSLFVLIDVEAKLVLCNN